MLHTQTLRKAPTVLIAALALAAAITLSASILWTSSASGGGTMHTGDLDGIATNKASWSAKVTITMHDASDKPLAGVTVGAAWGGGAKGTARCKTGRQGTCVVTSPSVAPGTTEVTLKMLGATLNGYTYDAAANHDPDGSSDGTFIVVRK